jgi:hypothetical protein
MISTVTFASQTVQNGAISGTLALIAVLVLIALLIQKELATAAFDSRFERLGQVLNVGIVPLFLAFVLIVATRVMDVLK